MKAKGFSLLEVLITLAVLSVGLLAYVKLLIACTAVTTDVYQQSQRDVEHQSANEKNLHRHES